MTIAAVLALVLSADVRIQPGTARPGDVVLVTVHGSRDVPQGTLGQQKLHFLPLRGGYQAIVGLSADMKVEAQKVTVKFKTDERPEEMVFALEVVEPHFNRDELKVDNKFTSPSGEQKRWMAADQKAFNAAFNQGLLPRLFEQGFEWPKLARITAPFGDLRLFNGKRKSQHYGTDLDGEVGDSAYAANDGVVVMNRECFGSGNTVIIHHGAGLYTSYFHLSRIDVKRGDPIKQGEQVGLVGGTGRVTGPHLHWGAKVNGQWVNAESLLNLDFE